MSDIVSEIITAVKARIPIVCPEFENELDYFYDLQMNAADQLEKKFGFIPLPADDVKGSLGFKRMDHIFQVILTEEVDNQDCDKDMRDKIESLYPCMFKLCKDFQSGCVVLPTPKNQLIQVKSIGFEVPEILGDNDGVALRMNLTFQYQLRK